MEQSTRGRRIRLIVNPAAGQERPILTPLNRIFRQFEATWDARSTTGPGDARRLTREAVAEGVDVVAIYGGDGSVMEAASELAGTDVTLAVIPGGSANIFAVELGIPRELEAAATLVCRGPSHVRTVDVGRLVGRSERFVVRVGMGFEAHLIHEATRGKGRNSAGGLFGYWLTGPQAMRRTTPARYRLVLDGRRVETSGVQCSITISGNISRRDMRLAHDIDPADGLLDVVVWRSRTLPNIVALAAAMLIGGRRPRALEHWQAREVQLEADPPQPIEMDGELCGETPVHATIEPRALRVLVPA